MAPKNSSSNKGLYRLDASWAAMQSQQYILTCHWNGKWLNHFQIVALSYKAENNIGERRLKSLDCYALSDYQMCVWVVWDDAADMGAGLSLSVCCIYWPENNDNCGPYHEQLVNSYSSSWSRSHCTFNRSTWIGRIEIMFVKGLKRINGREQIMDRQRSSFLQARPVLDENTSDHTFQGLPLSKRAALIVVQYKILYCTSDVDNTRGIFKQVVI